MGNTGPEARASYFQTKVSGRVLVIEDDPHVSEVVCIILTQEGYHTVPAVTGADALEKIHSEPWDGIILDICLPDFDGQYIMRQKSIHPEKKHIPVVAMSAAENRLRELAEKHYLQGRLSKPFDLDELIKAANQAFCRPSPLIAACRS